uniref:lamin tail domain-containing protein n=1 Tax=uncultured Deinococcus sp. TaxID=158789 RepID=UPI002586594B
GLNLTAQAPIQPTTPTAATSLSASPASLSVTSGGASAGSTVTASTQNYSGGNLTVSTSNAAGLTVSAPATAAPNGSFTVSVTAPAGTAAGTYPVTVTTAGDGGTPSASTTINVTVSSATTTPPTTGGSDLYFSEYVEGSSNNKAIEIYNPTSQTISLATYSVELYSNGATSSPTIQKLSGTLKPGATVVYVNSGANATLKEKGTVGAAVNFNGDDVLLLKNDTATIDAFGQIGQQVKWGENVTLRRKSTVTAGDTNPNDPFVPANEWDSFPIDTFDGLGSR